MLADDVEKWKGHSYGCALMNDAQSTTFGLILRIMTLFIRRYWRILWLCFILSGIFWTLFIVFQNSKRTIEIRDDSPVVNRRNVFYQSFHEQMAVPVFHPKQLKIKKEEKPKNQPKSIEAHQSKNNKIEKQVVASENIEIKNQREKTRIHSGILQKAFDNRLHLINKKFGNINKLEQKHSSREFLTQKPIEIDIKKTIKINGRVPKHSFSSGRIDLDQVRTTTQAKAHEKVKKYVGISFDYFSLH